MPEDLLNERALAALQAIYDRLPKIQCRGKCHDSCRSIDMTAVERDNIRDKAGVEIPRGLLRMAATAPDATVDAGAQCPALGMFKQCTVHKHRPLICRAYGVTESLPCPHGCQPDKALMSDREFFELMVDAMVVTEEWTVAEAKRVRGLLDDKQTMVLVGQVARGVPNARRDLYRAMRSGGVSPRYDGRVERGLNALQAVYDECA